MDSDWKSAASNFDVVLISWGSLGICMIAVVVIHFFHFFPVLRPQSATIAINYQPMNEQTSTTRESVSFVLQFVF